MHDYTGIHFFTSPFHNFVCNNSDKFKETISLVISTFFLRCLLILPAGLLNKKHDTFLAKLSDLLNTIKL